MSFPRSQSETARQRELYKYWQPNESVFPSAEYDESFNREYRPRPSYDSALTAYAQLGALRCNAKRGMISVVDLHNQYIIAEGTKTLSLQAGTVTDHNDELWFGLRTIPRQLGICATALGQFTSTQTPDGSISDMLFQPLQFIISDLSKDPRFVNQPFVCGPPFLRFYAGVPIRSPAGFIIGVYSIVDDEPREDFGENDLNILKDLAATVMDHLVLNTTRSRHHRADRMVKGLGLFIDGKSTLRDWWVASGHLANGPTTKDGSRGDWTLKAQAEAEFGPQVENEASDDGSYKQAKILRISKEDGESAGSSVFENPSALPMSIDALSGENPVHTRSSTSNKTTQNVVWRSPLGIVDSQMSERHASEIQMSIPPQTVAPHRPAKVRRFSSSDDTTLSTAQEIQAILSRASNLIRESIKVEGCLFLDSSALQSDDTATTSSDTQQEATHSQIDAQSGGNSYDVAHVPTMSEEALDENAREKRPPLPLPKSFSRTMCDVLGYSLTFDPQISPSTIKDRFRFTREIMQKFHTMYPHGGIFNFEEDGKCSCPSDEEDENGTLHDPSLQASGDSAQDTKPRSFLGDHEVYMIREALPNVRSLAFVPLWDSNTNCWFSGLFAWTNDPLRILDPADDMAYLAAFGNTIMAEKSRVDVALADKMKSNFMSTVSHELRSPLHGILASAELLKDMLTNAAQLDILAMINVCGRTLFDTVNHVLDYTELNRQRKVKYSNRARNEDNRGRRGSPPRSSTEPLANIDLSILTEEIVDGTVAGFEFGQFQSEAVSNLENGLYSSESKSQARRSLNGPKVILDIDYRSTWFLTCSPSAWRRILMHLVGNALKYTMQGQIYVSLKSGRSLFGEDGPPSVILCVDDTGVGISSDFLKHHIYTAFAQEDSFATGTGLGLSIVKQIVRELNGQISIKSEKGSGTQVMVQIPLATQSPSAGATSSSYDDEYFNSIRSKLRGKKLGLILSSHISGDDNAVESLGNNTAATNHMEKSIIKTLTQWFDLDVPPSAVSDKEAYLYLLLEEDGELLGAPTAKSLLFSTRIADLANTGQLIVLRTSTTPLKNRTPELWTSVPSLQQPFGPHKLARAFAACMLGNSMSNEQNLVSDIPIPPVAKELPHVDDPVPRIDLINPTASTQSGAGVVADGRGNIPGGFTSLPLRLRTKQSPEVVHAHGHTAHGNTILLVEDNEINLKLLIMYMRKLKYAYRTAVNGLEALQVYKEYHATIRFIITDISMPIMDGLTSTSEMRRYEEENGIAPSTIIAITGAYSAEAREKATACGVDRFLTKPVSLQTIRELIQDPPGKAENTPPTDRPSNGD